MKQDVPIQPVQIDGSNEGAFIGLSRLGFHQGRQDDRVVQSLMAICRGGTACCSLSAICWNRAIIASTACRAVVCFRKE